MVVNLPPDPPVGEGSPGATSGDPGSPTTRALGPALRRAWIGYQQRLDDGMAEAGFSDRRFPDGRVLRLCARHPDLTAARIGRELGMTRQGAGKIVAELRQLGYVNVAPSPTDGRHKVVVLTAVGRRYLDAHRDVARAVDRAVRARIGEQAMDHLRVALEVLEPGDEAARLRDHLRRTRRPGDAGINRD